MRCGRIEIATNCYSALSPYPRLIRLLIARYRLRLARWMLRVSAKLAGIGAVPVYRERAPRFTPDGLPHSRIMEPVVL
jgi:hypothetical protein